ncbi:hypothetical protein, partial [Azospirillum sp. B506]|uniref:hypothetical protein n=1 Tax=Azospirillum sp. B506 TaxID=137721 RepID=UPI001B3BD9B5
RASPCPTLAWAIWTNAAASWISTPADHPALIAPRIVALHSFARKYRNLLLEFAHITGNSFCCLNHH